MNLSLQNLSLCITTKRIIKTKFQNANKADQELVGSETRSVGFHHNSNDENSEKEMMEN